MVRGYSASREMFKEPSGRILEWAASSSCCWSGDGFSDRFEAASRDLGSGKEREFMRASSSLSAFASRDSFEVCLD